MAVARVEQQFTPEEYLALEREATFRSEYLDGRIYAMAGGSSEHSAITANFTAALGSALRRTSYRAFSSDLKVATGPRGLFTYPDLSVVCGEARFHDAHRDMLTNPKVIVEVLSPSTEAYDRGRKFVQYGRLESLTDYLLVSQEEPHIEHFQRQEGEQWLLSRAEGLAARVSLPSLDCSLYLSEVYDKIVFPEPPPP